MKVRRMIRHESIVTSLLGATVGLAIGAALAAVTSIALADYGVAFPIPIGTLATFVARRDRCRHGRRPPAGQAGVEAQRARCNTSRAIKLDTLPRGLFGRPEKVETMDRDPTS
ncbi:MAG: hypothetical protein M3327_04830 [Actinomycetota bacterium]|nr:hypothetical protein [Actinomycetota bacterium]